MQNYLDLCHKIYTHGVYTSNRTGVNTYSLPGQTLQYDLRQGFPLLTARRIPFKSVVAELVGFLRGVTSAADFRALGTKIWDANANENQQWLNNPHRKGQDDLGRIYGANWRDWQAPNGSIDQVAEVLKDLRSAQPSRRALWHAWNPAELDQMALPPCHLLYQFHAYGPSLALTVYIRSNDMVLGCPFNSASAALLLHIFAYLTGRDPWLLTLHIGDAHVYEDHIPGLLEMVSNGPARRIPQYSLPAIDSPDTATIDEFLDEVSVDAMVAGLYDYNPKAIQAKLRMAV